MTIEIDFKAIGLNVQKHRKIIDLQLDEFSNKTGINKQRLRTIENGSKTIKLIEIIAICNQLGVKLQDIIVYKVIY